MNKDLITTLKNHKPGIIGSEDCYQTAVFIPLIRRPGTEDYSILFELRSPKIKAQPGDICLPGGGMEPEDGSPEATAVRETVEELQVRPEQIEIIGEIDTYHTHDLEIYPFVGILHDYEGTYSPVEVEGTFTVPLSFFLETEPEVHLIHNQMEPVGDFPFERIHCGRDYKWHYRKELVYFYQYGDHTIWGITSRIIHNLVRAITH